MPKTKKNLKKEPKGKKPPKATLTFKELANRIKAGDKGIAVGAGGSGGSGIPIAWSGTLDDESPSSAKVESANNEFISNLLRNNTEARMTILEASINHLRKNFTNFILFQSIGMILIAIGMLVHVFK